MFKLLSSFFSYNMALLGLLRFIWCKLDKESSNRRKQQLHLSWIKYLVTCTRETACNTVKNVLAYYMQPNKLTRPMSLKSNHWHGNLYVIVFLIFIDTSNVYQQVVLHYKSLVLKEKIKNSFIHSFKSVHKSTKPTVTLTSVIKTNEQFNEELSNKRVQVMKLSKPVSPKNILPNPSQDSSVGSISAWYWGSPGFKSRQGREFFSENK